MGYLIGDGSGRFYPEAFMSAGTAHDLIQLITQTQIPEPEQPDSNLTSGQLSQMLTDSFGFEASFKIDSQYLTRAQTADCIWQAVVDQYIDRMNLVTEVQDPIITVSFGEFIGPKNCVYIDLNNKPWAEQLLAQGFAKETDFKKKSGFCTYPLWELDEDMLNECGGKKYKQYLKAREDYMPF